MGIFKWVYFLYTNFLGKYYFFYSKWDIGNGYIFEILKKMGILKWVYKIYPFLQMGIFFANGYILLNIPQKNTSVGGGGEHWFFLSKIYFKFLERDIKMGGAMKKVF